MSTYVILCPLCTNNVLMAIITRYCLIIIEGNVIAGIRMIMGS
jgi:hypothetical protein